MSCYVYILASKPYGTLYIGVTQNLIRRIYEHQNHLVSGFTEQYKISMLVHVENYSLMVDAIQREKNLKRWNRSWKITLIESKNPAWEDLSSNLF